MTKRYTITIVEHAVEDVITGKEWREGAGAVGEGGGQQHGYTPEIVKTQTVTRDIYMQNLDALNVTKVIEAVNGLGA